MARASFNRPRRLTMKEWVAVSASLAAIAVYLLVLRSLDFRAAAYFKDLRESDPTTYLVQLREAKGFDAYLVEYAEINDFSDFRPEPPSFLVGRWTLRDGALRLVPGQAPEVCSDPATFDFGLFLNVETQGVALAVQYRLMDDRVEMRSGNDSVFPIQLVSYGAQLDHIEFTPPGSETPVFGYLCGR